MADTHPELAAQWHPTLNEALKPADVFARTKKVIWWQCSFSPDHVSTVIRTGFTLALADEGPLAVLLDRALVRLISDPRQHLL